MSLRRRLIVSVTGITAITFALAFPAVYFGVNGLEERQLDSALHTAAEADAREGDPFGLGDRPGPAIGRLGPLTKYAAVYRADGSIAFVTATFDGENPSLPAPPAELVGTAFNFWFRREYLRGVVVRQPHPSGTYLLVAVPRSYLDGDDEALLHATGIVFLFAVLWAAGVTTWMVVRLTRYHEAIADVARRVAAGDLGARVGTQPGDRQTAQLARDVDEMINRLDQLVTSQKRFVAYAAHELRSPLTMLYGELAHARQTERDADSYRMTIEEAFEATERLKALTEDLLALARLNVNQPLTTSSFDVREMLDVLAKDQTRTASAKDVSIAVDAAELTFDGYAPDLTRMVRNLLENAIRHAPRGTQVNVEARATDDAIEIRVSDAGPGIPEGEEERIFEPFYRVASTREDATSVSGAGLGLAIAREIARGHGGDIALVRGATPGAAFVVRLPVSSSERAGPRQPHAPR